MGSQQKDDSLASSGEYKEVFVGPLAAKREAIALCIMIAIIIAFMMFRFSMVKGDKSDDIIKGYQRTDRILEDQDPLLYRSLRGVVGEITDLREDEEQWPSVEFLKNDSIPPFANDFLPLMLKGYRWTMHKTDGWVDYYGVNYEKAKSAKADGEPPPATFILRIIEMQAGDHPHPHAGSDKDANMKYSAQVWMLPETVEYPTGNVRDKGWKWIVSANDSNVIAEEPGQ